jgi:hypothetical protein
MVVADADDWTGRSGRGDGQGDEERENEKKAH